MAVRFGKIEALALEFYDSSSEVLLKRRSLFSYGFQYFHLFIFSAKFSAIETAEALRSQSESQPNRRLNIHTRTYIQLYIEWYADTMVCWWRAMILEFDSYTMMLSRKMLHL